MRISDWSADVCSSDLLLEIELHPLDKIGDAVGRTLDSHSVDDEHAVLRFAGPGHAGGARSEGKCLQSCAGADREALFLAGFALHHQPRAACILHEDRKSVV